MPRGGAMFPSVSLTGPHHVDQALLPHAVPEAIRILLAWDELGMIAIHTDSRHKHTSIP